MRNLLRSVSLLALASCAAASQALIDQSQTSTGAYIAGFYQGDLAQSFRPSVGTISGAGIFLFPVGNPTSVTISLYTGLPNAGGVLLGSGASGTAMPGSWVDVSFGSSISVVPETTYYLVFTSANNGGGIAGDLNDPYSRGQTYANFGYAPYPRFDYAFRTAYDAINPATPGPMAALPFALMALRRRKRA